MRCMTLKRAVTTATCRIPVTPSPLHPTSHIGLGYRGMMTRVLTGLAGLNSNIVHTASDWRGLGQNGFAAPQAISVRLQNPLSSASLHFASLPHHPLAFASHPEFGAHLPQRSGFQNWQNKPNRRFWGFKSSFSKGASFYHCSAIKWID